MRAAPPAAGVARGGRPAARHGGASIHERRSRSAAAARAERREAERGAHARRVAAGREKSERADEPVAERPRHLLLDSRRGSARSAGRSGRQTGTTRRTPCSRDSGRSARHRAVRARSSRRARVHQLDASARRVHLLVPEHVGRARRRQKPQWTQSEVSSRIMRSERTLRGSKLLPATRSASARSRLVRSDAGSARRRRRLPPGGRRPRRAWRAPSPSSPGANERGRRAPPGVSRDSSRPASASLSADERPRSASCAATAALGALEEHGHAARVEDVERARLRAASEEARATTPRRRPSRRRACARPVAAGEAGELTRATRARRPARAADERARS